MRLDAILRVEPVINYEVWCELASLCDLLRTKSFQLVTVPLSILCFQCSWPDFSFLIRLLPLAL